MWIIENETPFQAEKTFVRNKEGAEIWIVAVKGTYQILPDGSTEPAKEQKPICMRPEFFGEPGVSSIKYESDLILNKPGTDVILIGHAYAPEGSEVKETEVSLSVDCINKKLRVTGDRFWEKGLMGVCKTPIQPFDKMPLVYERAFGGTDQMSEDPKKHRFHPENPVGTGFVRRSANLAGERVPNIWRPKSSVFPNKSPAGFTPIAGNWMPRASYAGTYDENWQKTRKPLLPTDFDERFYQSAPLDQQVPGYLKGGEQVTLSNLTKNGKLGFTLPEEKLNFQTVFNQTAEEHQGNLHTVILEPDELTVSMVWHTALYCHNREHLLQGTLITMEQ